MKGGKFVKMPKNFGKNLAKSFKYGVVDTFLEKTAPDIAEQLKSGKEDIKSALEKASASNNGNIKKNQSSSTKNGLGDMRKNILADIKSGNWFGNKDRAAQSMMSSMGLDEMLGDDDFLDGLDFKEGTTTITKDQKTGDIDFSFETTNETHVTDNRTNVRNITQIQNNKVDGKLLATVTSQMVGNMSTISTQIKQISQFHLDETRRYYSDSLRLLTDINETLKKSYTLQTPKGQTSVLNEVFNGGSLSLEAYGKALTKGMMGGMLDKDTMEMGKMMVSNLFADPMKTAIGLAMDAAIPKAVKKGMGDLNENFTKTMKTLVLQLSEGKKGKGSPLQKFLGSILGLDLGTAKVKFENKVVPFDSETKRSIVNTIPELLLKIHGAITKLGGTGNGTGSVKELKIDPETGLPTYKEIKKERKADRQFASKLVGDKYDYSSAGLSEEGIKAQQTIDRLEKKIKELQDKKLGVLDTSQDGNISTARKLLHRQQMSLSSADREKIKKAQLSRDENFEEYSELLYKLYSTSDRGLNSSVLKTIQAKEFDRRANGGTVSDKSFDQMIKELSPEQQKVLGKMIRDIETTPGNKKSTKNTNKKAGEIWSEAKEGNKGFKGFFRTLATFTNEYSKQLFDNLNKGLSNIMFGNEKGLKHNLSKKVGSWADKHADDKGPLGWVAKRTKGFLDKRKQEEELRQKQMADDQNATRIAVETLLQEAQSDNCISVKVQRIGDKAKETFENIQNNVAEKMGVETDGKTGKEIRKGIFASAKRKFKSNFITDKMKEAGMSEDDKLTTLLHHRMKEFMEPITATFKEQFFGDDEDSVKNQIRFFLTGKKKKGDEKTGKSLLDRLSGDFLSYLRNPDGKKEINNPNSFLNQWKEIGLTFFEEFKYLTKNFIKMAFNGLKRYYKFLLVDIPKKVLGMFGRTKTGEKFKSFGREMGERVMGVTNVFRRMSTSLQEDQISRINKNFLSDETEEYDLNNGKKGKRRKLNVDAISSASNEEKAQLLKNKGLMARLKKENPDLIKDLKMSVGERTIADKISSLQSALVDGPKRMAAQFVEGLRDFERSKGKHREEIKTYEHEAKKEAKSRGLKGKSKKSFIQDYSKTKFDLAHESEFGATKYTKAAATDKDGVFAAAKGSFDADVAKKAEEEKAKQTADQQTAEATSKLVEQNEEGKVERSSRFKKIISYVTMGFLLMKGGTKTISTAIKGVVGAVKVVAKVIKGVIKILAVPLKILNGLTKGAAGKLISSGLLVTMLYTYLASKVITAGKKAIEVFKTTGRGIGKAAKFVGGVGKGIGGGVSGFRKSESKGFMGKMSDGLKGFKSGSGLFKNKANVSANSALNIDQEKMQNDPVYQAKVYEAEKIRDAADIRYQATIDQIQGTNETEKLIAEQKLKNNAANLAEEQKGFKGFLAKMFAKRTANEATIEGMKTAAATTITTSEITGESTSLMQRLKMKLTGAQTDVAIKSTAATGTAVTDSVSSPLSSAVEALANVASGIPVIGPAVSAAIAAFGGPIVSALPLLAPAILIPIIGSIAASGKVKDIGKTIGSKIGGLAKKFNIKSIFKKAMAGSKMKKAKNASKREKEKERLKAIMSSKLFKFAPLPVKLPIFARAKMLGITKEEMDEYKEQKKEDKRNKMKERIKAVITSEEFTKMSKPKQIFWKFLAKKYGVSTNASQTNATASAIGSLNDLNKNASPSVLASAMTPVVGQEQDGMIWTGGKWESKANLKVGRSIGNSVWDGEKLVAKSKDEENKNEKAFNEKVLSTGLLGETMDSKTTSSSSLGSKLKKLVGNSLASIKDGISNILGLNKDTNSSSSTTPLTLVK